MKEKTIGGKKWIVYEQQFPLEGDLDAEDFHRSLEKEEQYEKDFKELLAKCRELLKDADESRPSVYWKVGDLILGFEKRFPEKEEREKYKTKYNVKTNFLVRFGKELNFKLRTIRAIREFRDIYASPEELDESVSYYIYHELIPLKNDAEALNYLDGLLRTKAIKDRYLLRKIVNEYKKNKTKNKEENLELLKKIISAHNK